MKFSFNIIIGFFKFNNFNVFSKSGNLISSMSIFIYSIEYEEDEIERSVYEMDY